MPSFSDCLLVEECEALGMLLKDVLGVEVVYDYTSAYAPVTDMTVELLRGGTHQCIDACRTEVASFSI